MIPSEVGLLTKLSKSSFVWLLVVMIVLSCVSHCTLMLACHIHSTDTLHLYNNSLTGTFPSEIALMSNLGELSVVWLLVVMIVFSCNFHCTLMLACHIHSTVDLDLSDNSLTGTIPCQIALLSNLSKSSVVWLLVVMIVLSCVSHCTLMLACHIHSTAYLVLDSNSLTGTIPSEVGLLSKLSESSVVWLLVVMIVLSCVFFIVLSCLLVIFHSTDALYLSRNSLTGTIPSEVGLMSNLGESSVVWLLVVMIVLSCVFFIALMLACHFSFYRYVVSPTQ
jgi:hypothetical protein